MKRSQTNAVLSIALIFSAKRCCAALQRARESPLPHCECFSQRELSASVTTTMTAGSNATGDLLHSSSAPESSQCAKADATAADQKARLPRLPCHATCTSTTLAAVSGNVQAILLVVRQPHRATEVLACVLLMSTARAAPHLVHIWRWAFPRLLG